MKKFSIVIILLLFTMTLLGCNKDEIGEVFLNTPVNLSITGDKLLWDEVEGAKGYIVYEDNIQVEKVKTNEYIFNSNSTDRIIFTVRAIAPRGSEDSPMSLKIAFVPNYQDEVNAVNVFLDDIELNFSPLLAEELVSKGMLASDMEDMIDNIDDILNDYSGDSDSSFVYIYDSLSQLLSETNNYEAIISALIVCYVPSVIETEIYNLQEKVDEMADYFLEAPDSFDLEPLEKQRTEVLETIDLYESILTQIEETPDILILSLCESIDYLITINDYASNDLVNSINDLLLMDDPTKASVTELYQMVEEIKSVFEETKPSREELVAISSMEQFLYLNLDASESPSLNIENLYGKRAYQLSLSIDAFIQFLDIIDENYITKMIDYKQLYYSPEYGINIAALNAEYVNNYLKTNETLLDNLFEVFSKSEQEFLFNTLNFSNVATEDITNFSYYPLMYSLEVLDNLSFLDVYNAKLAAKDFFEVFVEEVANDNTFIELYMNYSEYGYYVSSMDEEYGSRSQYQFTFSIMRNDLLEETYRILDVYNSSLDKESFLSVLTILYKNTAGSVYGMQIRNQTSSNLDILLELFNTVTKQFDTELYDFYIDGITYINDESYFDGLTTIFNSYLDIEVDLNYSGNIRDIKNYLALDDFLTAKRVKLLEDIFDEIIEEISQSEFKSEFDLTTTDIETIETNLDAYLELLTQANEELGDIDLLNLTSSDQYTYLMYQAELTKISNNIAKTLYSVEE